MILPEVVAFAGPSPLSLRRDLCRTPSAASGFCGARPASSLRRAGGRRVAARVVASVSVTGLAEEGGVGDVVSEPRESSITSAADVEEIVGLVKRFKLKDFRLVDGDVAVEISMPGGRGFTSEGALREDPVPQQVTGMYPPGMMPQMAAPQGEYEEDEYGEVEEDESYAEEFVPLEPVEEVMADEDGVFPTDFVVTSNRVGFFFSGGKGKPPLANIGDHVAFNQPVCIIEQLGQQYVYLAEVSGTVVTMYVDDGDSVMFGSKVMAIRPGPD